MSLDISSLKYYGVCNNKQVEVNSKKNSEIINASDYKKEAEKMLSEHNQKTDEILSQFEELHKCGKISDSEYRMAKLETTANDLIYQLGMNALYGT